MAKLGSILTGINPVAGVGQGTGTGPPTAVIVTDAGLAATPVIAAVRAAAAQIGAILAAG